MNKLSALALGTALALSLPFAALAQDAGADGGVSTEPGGVDAEAGTALDAPNDASLAAEASAHTYGDLDAALQGAGSADLSTITADTEIEIVTVSSLGDDGDFTAEAYDEARAGHESDVATLQGNVEGNADIVAALEADGYAVEDVVAVWSQPDGTLTVFVDDGGAAANGEAGVDAGAPTGTTIDSGLDAGGTDLGTEVETDAEGEAVTAQ